MAVGREDGNSCPFLAVRMDFSKALGGCDCGIRGRLKLHIQRGKKSRSMVGVKHDGSVAYERGHMYHIGLMTG